MQLAERSEAIPMRYESGSGDPYLLPTGQAGIPPYLIPHTFLTSGILQASSGCLPHTEQLPNLSASMGLLEAQEPLNSRFLKI